MPHSTFHPISSYSEKKSHPAPTYEKRLIKRERMLGTRMLKHSSCIIHRIAENASELRGMYRFLENEKVDIRELIHSQTQIASDQLSGRQVLCLIDGTSLNFSTAYGRMDEANRDKLGVLENNETPGMMASVALSIDEQSHEVLGLTDILMYHKEKRQDPTRSRAYRKLPYLKRASSKYYINALNSKEKLIGCAQLTYVIDRGGDGFLTLEHINAIEGTDFVIRMRGDRRVMNQGQVMKLASLSSKLAVKGEYVLKIKALNHKIRAGRKIKKRKARTSRMQLRWTRLDQVEVSKEAKQYDKSTEPIPHIYYVEVSEHAEDVPEGEEAIHWKLFTSREVSTEAQAKEVIRIYTARWHIEQLFRVCKHQGMELESSQIETVEGLQRLVAMTFPAACKIMQLTMARGKDPARDLSIVFDEEEQQVLEKINEKVNGRTEKSKNPYSREALSWATWIIGRLGGWKGYYSQGPPGPISIIRGYRKFQVYKEAFILFNST